RCVGPAVPLSLSSVVVRVWVTELAAVIWAAAVGYSIGGHGTGARAPGTDGADHERSVDAHGPGTALRAPVAELPMRAPAPTERRAVRRQPANVVLADAQGLKARSIRDEERGRRLRSAATEDAPAQVHAPAIGAAVASQTASERVADADRREREAAAHRYGLPLPIEGGEGGDRLARAEQILPPCAIRRARCGHTAEHSTARRERHERRRVSHHDGSGPSRQGSIADGPEGPISPAVHGSRYHKAAGHGRAEAETRESLRALHAQRGRATRVRAPQGGAVLLCGIAA